MIQLPADWSACERGNVYVVSPDGQHLAYFKMQDLRTDNNEFGDYWLEVSLASENYPSFNVAVVKFSEKELVDLFCWTLTLKKKAIWVSNQLKLIGLPYDMPKGKKQY